MFDIFNKIFDVKVEEVCIVKQQCDFVSLCCDVEIDSELCLELCNFEESLCGKIVNGQVGVIVEVKKVLFFKGVICFDFKLVEIVVSYVEYGVVCLLVLIDE